MHNTWEQHMHSSILSLGLYLISGRGTPWNGPGVQLCKVNQGSEPP